MSEEVVQVQEEVTVVPSVVSSYTRGWKTWFRSFLDAMTPLLPRGIERSEIAGMRSFFAPNRRLFTKLPLVLLLFAGGIQDRGGKFMHITLPITSAIGMTMSPPKISPHHARRRRNLQFVASPISHLPHPHLHPSG